MKKMTKNFGFRKQKLNEEKMQKEAFLHCCFVWFCFFFLFLLLYVLDKGYWIWGSSNNSSMLMCDYGNCKMDKYQN
jgi:hypothetical protein